MMRADIHSHTAPAKYLEAIRRDPRSMGCRVEKDDQGRESVVQDNGRSTRVRTNLIEPELRLREMAAEQVDVIVESLLPPLLPLWAPTAVGVRVCQVVNDAIAEDAKRYPAMHRPSASALNAPKPRCSVLQFLGPSLRPGSIAQQPQTRRPERRSPR
mgnify:CR=1 FL=1